MDNQKLLIGLGILIVAILGYCYYCKNNKEKQVENFTYDQVALNAKNYTFIPSRNCQGCLPESRPDFASMTCNASGVPEPLQGMTKEQIQQEIDLHYRKPMEMVDTKDLLPETDISGLSFGTDPSEDFAN